MFPDRAADSPKQHKWIGACIFSEQSSLTSNVVSKLLVFAMVFKIVAVISFDWHSEQVQCRFW